MKNIKNRSLLADMSLFLVALIWGGGFVAVKDALNSVTPLYMLAIRFTFAFLPLALIFYKRIKKIKKQDIISGCIVGIFLFGGFAFQTIGLQYTTPGKQAFLTAVYVIIVPFLSWIVGKTRPDLFSIMSALLTLVGIGFLSIGSGFGINLNSGDLLTLICALLFAAQIAAIAHFAKKTDPIVLSIVQMAFAAVVSFISALIFEPKFTGISNDAIFSIFYLVVFSTMLAFLIQNVAQKYADPTHVGIILCFESVFGAILSVIILKDVFTPNMITGCSILFVAVIVSETKLNFLRPLSRKEKIVSNVENKKALPS